MNNKKKNKNTNSEKNLITEKIENIINTTPSFDGEILSDVFGSYTGVPLDGGDPIQDADDL